MWIYSTLYAEQDLVDVSTNDAALFSVVETASGAGIVISGLMSPSSDRPIRLVIPDHFYYLYVNICFFSDICDIYYLCYCVTVV